MPRNDDDLTINRDSRNDPIPRIEEYDEAISPGRLGIESSRQRVDETSTSFAIALGADAPPLELIRVNAGSFLFGSNREDPERLASETIQQRVAISKPYYLGKHEVTHEQFKALTGENPSRFDGQGTPINNITYDQINQFITKLDQKLVEAGYINLKARLPSQEEWEYAARCGEPGAHAGISGDDLSEYAWFDAGSGRPLPVGSLKPNLWGFHDMYGNMEEVTIDGHMRGGSFKSTHENQLRSASVRYLNTTFVRDLRIGFRVLIEETD